MSTATSTSVGYADLMRDVRHLAARAAPTLADWLAFLTVAGKAEGTLYTYTREVAPLLRRHPDLTIEEFTADHINHELALKPERSRYITRSIYNGFFQWAEDQERIARNPMRGGVPKMRQPKRRPKDIFSEEEIALLENTRDGHLWTILFRTGLRRAEARNLRREHISLDRARLVVYHGKGDKDRIVGLPLTVLRAVADLDLTEGLRRDDYLWYSRPGGGRHKSRRAPIGDTTFERWYRNGIEEAGVRYLNPHQTRHTYGHWLREQNLDIEERKVAMGHESIRTTEHFYGRVNEQDVAAKIAEIGL